MAATDFETAVSQVITSSNQHHDVINGTATETVTTDSGEIPTLRKSLVDNFYFLDPLPWTDGVNEEVFNQIRDFEGLYYYAPTATTVNPVPMGTTPVRDNNWVLSPFASNVVNICSNTNLLSNHNFLIASPDDSQPPPDATLRSYPPGFQIFSGVFANETTGITNLTYVDGRVSFSGGDFYMPVANTGAIARLTFDQLVASVADFDGKPRTRGVSFSLVGDEYRVTVGIDALEDSGGGETLLGSVKFEQGDVATRHQSESLSSRNLSDYTDIVYASVSDMVTGSPISVKLNQDVSCAAGSAFKRVSISTPPTLSDFENINTPNIVDFGATPGGVFDNSQVFNDLPPGIYKGPSGVFACSGFDMKSNLTIIGPASMVEWARLPAYEYTKGFVLKLLDGANKTVVNVPEGLRNVSIQNAVIDVNGQNQTAWDIYGIKSTFGMQRTTGQNWSGTKVVNSKSFSAFLAGGPIDISHCFFEKGAILHRCADLKLTGVDFDGTDGLHPSLMMVECQGSNLTTCFAWGWGEVAGNSQTLLSNNILINATNNTFTVSSGNSDWLHDDQVAILLSATSYPTTSSGLNRFRTWFVQDEGGGAWSLWTRPKDNENRQQFTFDTTGSDVVLAWGSEDVVNITSSFRIGIDGLRAAGSAGGAIRLVETNNSPFSGLKLWGLNYNDIAGRTAITVIDSSDNQFSSSNGGEDLDQTTRIDHAMSFIENDGTCNSNVVDDSYNLFKTRSPELIRDFTSNEYQFRNRFIGIAGVKDEGSQRVQSDTYFLQPNIQAFTGRQDTTSISPNANTRVNIVSFLQRGCTASGNSVFWKTTPQGKYLVKGFLRLKDFDNTLTGVLVKVKGFTASGDKNFKTWMPGVADDGHGVTLAFDFELYDSSGNNDEVFIEIFTEGGGAGMSLDASSDYSSLSISKVADIPFHN